MILAGEYDLDDFKTYLRIIYSKCESEGIYKLFMNCLDIKGIDIPTLERYLLGIETAELLGYKVKLAFVWHSEYVNHFGETVANNRGARVGVFVTIDAALNWLLNDVSPKDIQGK